MYFCFKLNLVIYVKKYHHIETKTEAANERSFCSCENIRKLTLNSHLCIFCQISQSFEEKK